ncbi:MAG: papain-like cysteine protease family protein [Patescibacteria group bacterium]|nr:MAG: papain-like cysteine protease family protein [Patescibacteria group bacterium]
MKANWQTKKLGDIFDRFKNRNLKVPFIYQINENACGAAVLEMVYKYYGLNDVSQEEIYKKYKQLEPHGTGNFRITTDALVADSLRRGFLSFWNKVDYNNPDECFNLLQFLTKKSKIPIIVCQQFTKNEEHKDLGHFRLVVGVDKKNKIIYVHDPHKELGGQYQKWSLDKFVDFWQPTGQNVTGGVFVIIKKL